MRKRLNHQGTKTPRLAWCLGALVVIAFLPALQIGFLNDDISMISFTFDSWHPNLANLFNSRALMGLYYRPLVDLSFALDHTLGGWNATGFRLTNILLHL